VSAGDRNNLEVRSGVRTNSRYGSGSSNTRTKIGEFAANAHGAGKLAPG